MKLSRDYFYTLRENVRDEDSNSGNLLVRAGYIKKSFTESRLIPLLFPKYPNLQKAMKQRDEKYNRSLEYISNLLFVKKWKISIQWK